MLHKTIEETWRKKIEDGVAAQEEVPLAGVGEAGAAEEEVPLAGDGEETEREVAFGPMIKGPFQCYIWAILGHYMGQYNNHGPF